MKQIINFSPTFNPALKTLNFSSMTGFELKKLVAVINSTSGQVIYASGKASLGYVSFAANILTLVFDTTTQNAGDILQVLYDTEAMVIGGLDKDGEINSVRVTENDALAVGNAIQKFRDGFVTGTPDVNTWDVVWNNQGSSSVDSGGDSFGASYMRVSMCPITAESEFICTSKQMFKFPVRFGYGMSLSQRYLGQEFELSLVGCDADGVVDKIAPFTALAISGTVSVTTNVATINFATAHGLKGGDRVVLFGNSEKRLNVGPVIVTVVTSTQITVPCTLANATYTAGGSVYFAHPLDYVSNSVGLVYENTTVTNASFVAVRNGAKFKSINSTVITTTAIQSNTNPYTDAFNSAGDMEILANMEEAIYRGVAADGLAAPTGSGRFSQGIPDEEKFYKIRIRAKNLINLSRPVARITAISKTGTTTATVTTDVAHGLAVNDLVQIYGVRDIANFPNLVAQTAVASIVSPTQFTIIIGTASTTSSAGGMVFLVNGSVLATTAQNINVQSISRTNNILTIIGNSSWAGLLSGEFIQLHGCNATSMGLYDGYYKVLRIASSILEVESIGTNFTSINCGGAVIKRTDFRLNYVRLMDFTRHTVELTNSRGVNDAQKALSVNGTVGISGTVASTQSGGWTVATGYNALVADVASAAITTTTTTAAFTPSSGVAYQVNIPVTAVTGTTPTLDVSIEESDDNGTNWFKVYDFPRITAVGFFRSPVIMATGTRLRYVQTITGTTPSFTRAINRLAVSNPSGNFRQLIDRTIVPNTLNSVTPFLYVEGCQDFNVFVRCTAQTTPATLTLQFSDDSTNWHTTGNTLTTSVGIAHIKVANEQWKFARVITSVAGSGITLAELTIKSVGK